MKKVLTPLTRTMVQKLINFLPYFKENQTIEPLGFSARKTGYDPDNPNYPIEVNNFIKESLTGFTIFPPREFNELWEHSDRKTELIQNIPKAGFDMLRMLLGRIILQDKVYRESILTIINEGVILKILLRMAELIDELHVVKQEDEEWIKRLFNWADKKNIPNYYYENGTWSGLPRDKELLLNLKKLDIGWNKLGELPKEICNLTNLIELSLWCSKLKKLPKEIGNLVNLKELSLVDNKLSYLPGEIGNLKSLEVLNLGSNPIKELPAEIGSLTNLKELDLIESRITELPKEIGLLEKLTELRLEENKKLTKLPVEIGRLHNLQQLILRDNKIVHVPKEIGNLINLTRLDLSYNNLRELPKEIDQLVHLKSLDLDGNKLSEIPELPMNKKKNTIEVNNVLSIESPREVLHHIYDYIEELPIRGGWGYSKGDAVVIDMNDPIVNKHAPFNGINIEYVFAKHRTYLELITMRDEDDRYFGIEFEATGQELHHGEDGKKYDKLILEITALRSQDFRELKEEWESNLNNKNFDEEEHIKRKEKLQVHIEREFWFEISSFYGKNFVILDESDEDGVVQLLK